MNARTFAGLPLGQPETEGADFGRWLIHGPQGSGKTTLASTVAGLGRTLFIDLVGEQGTRSFQGAPWAKNVDIIRPASITALDDVFWELDSGDHQFKAVVIDSLTSVQKMAMRYLLGHSETAVKEIKKGIAPADMRTWGQTLDIMQDVATFWYGLANGRRPNPMHVVMTAQTKINENELTGETSLQPDVQKGALSMVLAAPDYVLYTDTEVNDDAMVDDSLPPRRHIVRFGADSKYRTKARVPFGLEGKIPPVLGRKSRPNLATLSKVLNIGGTSSPTNPKTSAPTVGADSETEPKE